MAESWRTPARPWNDDPRATRLGEPAVPEAKHDEPSSDGRTEARGPAQAERRDRSGQPPGARHPLHVELPKLTSDPDTASVVQLAVAAAVNTFLEHDEKAAGGSVRGVHQARVGLRRFRSHLRTFRRVIDTEWASPLSAEASWFAESLGAVRDLDVLHGRLVEGAMLQVPESAPAIAELVEILEGERSDALEALREIRRTARFDGLVGRLVEAAGSAPTRGKADEPAGFLMPVLLRRTWHDLRGAADSARRDPTVAHLHRVRICAKRMRYASEAASEVLGAPAKRAARASEELQERLGEWHDASAAQGWLERSAGANPRLAEVAGRLAAMESDAAGIAANLWRTDYRKIKKGWKRVRSRYRV